nr:hypothetical protein [Candidatus Woesearchaeota archaeon]
MKITYFILILFLLPFVYAQECNGCIYQGVCVETGAQKIINQNLFYCSEDLELRNAKFYGYECKENYECISFYCKDNKCNDLNYGKEFDQYSKANRLNEISKELIDIISIVLVIVVGILLLLVLFGFINKRGKFSKKNKKGKKEITYGNYAKNSKRKSEKLEKDIERSFKDVRKNIK